MDRPRILRLMRITFSAVFGILCLLLIVLWVRSDLWQDSASVGIAGRRVGATSVKQRIIVALHYPPALGVTRRWHLGSESIDNSYRGMTEAQIIRQIGLPEFPGFSFRRLVRGGFRSVIPHWCPIVVAAVLATIPWIKWTFSLRTLLFATALVAVALGLIVALR